ncbi:hypothetical protein Tco_0134796 [Tanacetum coccineum]
MSKALVPRILTGDKSMRSADTVLADPVHADPAEWAGRTGLKRKQNKVTRLVNNKHAGPVENKHIGHAVGY